MYDLVAESPEGEIAFLTTQAISSGCPKKSRKILILRAAAMFKQFCDRERTSRRRRRRQLPKNQKRVFLRYSGFEHDFGSMSGGYDSEWVSKRPTDFCESCVVHSPPEDAQSKFAHVRGNLPRVRCIDSSKFCHRLLDFSFE